MADLLQINSVSRASGTTQKCTFHLDRPISGTYQLVGCQVPYLEPPEATARNSLVFRIGTYLKVISFTSPVYTSAQLVSGLKARLDAAGSLDEIVFTVTLNSQNCLVISRSTGADITFYARFPTSTTISGLSAAKNTDDLNTKLADTLGITNDVVLTGATSSTITFPSPVNLAQVLSYHININNDSQVETTDGSRSTFIIPIHVDSFELQKYNVNENPKQLVTFRNATKVLDIE